MLKKQISLLLSAFWIGCLFLISCSAGNEKKLNEKDHQAYLKEISDWDAKRVTGLKAEDGWLNLAGRFWLKKGKNTAGSDSTCDLVFPAGKAPAKLGYFTLDDSTVSFTAMPGLNVMDSAKPFKSGVVFDKNENAVTLSYGSLRWFVIKRGDRYAVRLRDLESEELKRFKGIERFPVDENWRIEADFDTTKTRNQNITMQNVIGSTTDMPFAGIATFERNGQKYRLRVALDDSELFVVFADSTTGKETYHSGRFMHPDAPKDGKIILDFNKAYNPPCAFTDFATCPLPPKDNILPFAVNAGEKAYER
jgi:hypothetical protein